MRKDKGGNPPQEEEDSDGNGEGWHQHRPIQ